MATVLFVGERVSFDILARRGNRNFWLAMAVMLGIIGTLSAFVTNTVTFAIFIPVVTGVARELDPSPSKVPMPLSFISLFGGVCSLVGTITNILVSSIATDYGLEPFSMCE